MLPTLHVELDPRINFALQQNDVPVIKALHVENPAAEAVESLRLSIHASPGFADPWEARIERIPAGGTYNLRADDLRLSPLYLQELTERIRGQLRFELHCGDRKLAERVESVTLLARDEWSGLASLPEILAAFVMPNHPAVGRVLQAAASTLDGWTGDQSLSGYQFGVSERVYLTGGAVYAALQGLDLTYVNPPASFEDEGQRIRLPGQVEASRMATCLDVAVLAAACLEQAGLHPLVVIVEGHAFVGFWMREESFPEPSLDEPTLFRKRVDLREIAVFDPTCATTHPRTSFDRAVKEARHRLDAQERFRCVIDVFRARKGGIRPLPERVRDAEDLVEEAASVEDTGPPPLPDLGGVAPATPPPEAAEAEGPPDAGTRLDRWCRKLLDLSLRNRLLNFKETKKTIPLLCRHLADLEDALAAGRAFAIRDRPKDLGESDPRDADAHRHRTGEDALDALLRDELTQKRLHADLPRKELDRRLLEVYRAARLGLEEGGASALYLAFGFLRWFENENSEQERRAPILLVPVQLKRRSVLEGFSLALGDDEPRLNVTLVELLNRDHGIHIEGLDPLPEDESGLNVPLILDTFLQKVKNIPRWDVLPVASIGIFSFAKFLMWRDLMERTGDLLQSPLVDHLVNRPDREFTPGAAFPEAERLDEERPPTATFCAMPADSSQLAAVFAAADGRTFVLKGPPGTGKSQTITNLIAHCLAEGKRVLFVSEKMAALSVVHRRLCRIGLARFCLELHSNKAQKSKVLAQLERSLDATTSHDPHEWKRKADELERLRGELNEYVKALHRKRRNGLSLFLVTSRLIGLRNTPRVPLAWEGPEALDADQLAGLRDLVQGMAHLGADLGDLRTHAWCAAGRGDWTPVWQNEVVEARERLAKTVEELAHRTAAIADRVGLGEEGWSRNELAALGDLAEQLVDAPAPPASLLVRGDWETIASQIEPWLRRGRHRDTLRAEVLSRYRQGVLDLDLEALQRELTSAESSFWPFSWLGRRKIRKTLQTVTKDGRAPPGSDLAHTLQHARALCEEETALKDAGPQAQELFGRYWKDGEADWDELDDVRAWAERLRSFASRFAAEDWDRAVELRRRWAQLATEGRELLRADGTLGQALSAFRSALNECGAARSQMEELLELDADEAWGAPHAPDLLGTCQGTLERWAEAQGELRLWCAWRRQRQRALEYGLRELVSGMEAGTFDNTVLLQVFDRSYYQWWFEQTVTREPILARFVSLEHERKIQQFRQVDAEFLRLTKDLITARLASKVPAGNVGDLPESEVGILRRELQKRRRHMPVRRLFRRIPNLLPRLKPCLLMGPISVAQYLDAAHPAFDVVVFDEASQIPVWDAVGALARGQQAVVVGDPKQLPPTSFFQRAESEEEESPVEIELVEDLESILDDCLGAGVPCLDLRWHYRSRHESLIAFSNYHYYDNRLLTFPSPLREELGVSWRHVADGVYDRGRSATNRKEAEAVVAEIVRRLKDPRLSSRTIGVVTFSQAQQTLIEDLLEEVRQGDRVIDGYFSEEKIEPVFVKNLENVQGDERDVILFSICYGPDEHGRISMNFGPMNKDGGERRLNVAITRARREVIVFSTLKADQIDLARTNKRGVRDLKTFLAYADRGMSAITEATALDPTADFDSPFEEEVHDRLVDRGWQVHRQVGCGGYRIDLAVVDPEAPGRYLLGVECDGANYHRAKTARDRDKLREGVLRDLGWQLHRIWSTDWWNDPQGELRKLEQALSECEATRHEGPPEPPSTEVEVIREAPTDLGEEPEGRVAAAPSLVGTASPESFSAPVMSGGAAPYEPCPVQMLGLREDFYDGRSTSQIRAVIGKVVDGEGPISLMEAARRVAAHWGLERVRKKARDLVLRSIPSGRVRVVESEAGVFLWPLNKDPTTHDEFRLTGWSADDLPPEEVAAAALYLLRQHISVPENDLVRVTSRLFGFARTGARVDARMRIGVDMMIDRGCARREGEKIILQEG